jgi:pimeloyl-ACP methyl ester carboxylesterase
MRWLLVVSLLALAPSASAAQRPGDVRSEPFTLELGSREVETRLTRLAVPTNRRRGDGATIEIAYAVLPATTDTPGAPIVYLAGGPGGSGISEAGIPHMAELFESLREVGDVVLVDQRGTGRSLPRLACPNEGRVPADVFASRERMTRLYGAAAARCAERFRAMGIEPSDFDTEESADDLDDVRRALGAERIRLVGFSYGTHLALAAIRRHGDRIERAVLAGTEGLGETYKLPSTYDAQVRTLAEIVARDSAAGPFVPDFEVSLRSVVERLWREPVSVTVTDRDGTPVELTIGSEGFLYLLRRDIGDTNDLPLFPAWIHEMERGGTGILARFAGKRYIEMGRGVSVMSIAVDCASGVEPERLARIESEIPASIFGRMTNLLEPESCESVGVEDLDAAFRAPFESDVPALFVSGTLDSNTPPAQAEAVRAGFANGVHVVVENAGHESTLPLREVQALIRRFLSGGAVGDRRIAGPPLVFEPIPRMSGS